MGTAACLLGREKFEIKEAKLKGCTAFLPGNRIDMVELRRWFDERTDSAGTVTVQSLNKAVDFLNKIKIPGCLPRTFLTTEAMLQSLAVNGAVANGIPKKEALKFVVRMTNAVERGQGEVVWE